MLKKHPVISGFVASVVFIVGFFGSSSGAWSFFSSEPLGQVIKGKADSMNVSAHFAAWWITTPISLLMFYAIIYNVRRRQKFSFDYAYSLVVTGIAVGVDDSTTPATMQISLLLRNVAGYPIRYLVENLEVIIDSRTNPNPTFVNRGIVICRGQDGRFFCPSYDVTMFAGKARITGVIRFTFTYGHPDTGMVRRMSQELDITMRTTDWLLSSVVKNESDVEIKASD
jgi:hypothetical protein